MHNACGFITGRPEEIMQKLYSELECCFCEKAYVYAILDFAVSLGYYEMGKILVGLADTLEITELPLEYVRELRVFNTEREYRAIRKGDGLATIVVKDEGDLVVIEEAQKLWGEVKRSIGLDKWGLLESDRGTRILFPEDSYTNGKKISTHTKKALLVKRYFCLMDKGGSLYQFCGERLSGLADWPINEGGGL